MDRRVRGGARRPGYAGLCGRHWRERGAGARPHLRRPGILGHRAGRGAQRGARGRHLHGRQPGHCARRPHGRRADDCSDRLRDTWFGLRGNGKGRKTLNAQPAALSPELLGKMDAYWRAANYLSVGQIYLYDNPLLKRPLALADIKHMLLGHWGTSPGQNFIYVHLNRVIKKYDLDMIYVSGPGHGGPALVGNTYLEGTYSEIYPDISLDEEGLRKLFIQFSFPGGIPSHVSPECPGSIHEGGELGYSLSHSFGAVFDNPDLIVACVVGDGEAETGPLATAWHSNKFLDPATDGAVLPILHLNGYKISNPTVLARITRDELEQLLRGYGRDARHGGGRDQADPAERPHQRRPQAAALADDRPQFAQGLDRAEDRRWPAGRRHLPGAPGAALRPGHPSRTPQAAGRLAAQLPAGGALR